MGTIDRDEQIIKDAFSKITVDASDLAGKVKSLLNEKKKPLRRVPWSLAAALLATVLFGGVVTAATQGSFDWLIRKINPSFGEIIEQVEIWCEDQGIRMEVIGAQKYENMAVVYLSVQDVSGQNRLTEQTQFRDGFNVKMNVSETNETDEAIVSAMSYRSKLLYFDEAANTVYFEFNITADSISPMSDPLTLGSFLIYFDEKRYEYEPVPLHLSGLPEPNTALVQPGYIFGGSLPENLGKPSAILAPGNYAPMPHGEDDQWISNIGILNGKLHVQIGKVWNKEFGSSDANLCLMSKDGEIIDRTYKVTVLTHANNRLFDVQNGDYSDVAYKYDETVFDVNIDKLDDYTLCFNGLVHSGVEGLWKVTANLSDTSRQVRIWSGNISIGGHLFEYLTLSPLGLQVIGSYEGGECTAGEMTVSVETYNGIIPLYDGGGSHGRNKFNLHWNTETPFDVSSAAAVIIDDIRIVIK